MNRTHVAWHKEHNSGGPSSGFFFSLCFFWNLQPCFSSNLGFNLFSHLYQDKGVPKIWLQKSIFLNWPIIRSLLIKIWRFGLLIISWHQFQKTAFHELAYESGKKKKIGCTYVLFFANFLVEMELRLVFFLDSPDYSFPGKCMLQGTLSSLSW